MKQIWRGFVGGLFGLLLATSAASAQTSYGSTGLFVHPTAQAPESKGIHLNISYLHIPSSKSNKESHWIPINLGVGISDRAEVGATYVNRIVSGDSFGSGGLFGKYLLCTDQGSRPAVAVVGNFLSGNIKLNSLALAASKGFRQENRLLGTLHVGVQRVGWKDDKNNSSDERVFLGASIPIHSRFALIGEIGSRLKFDPAGTAGIGIQYNGIQGLHIGTGYANNGRARHGGFFFGIGRPIGGD